MEEERLLTQEFLSSRLIQICRELDADNSGELSKDELVHGYDNIQDFREALLELQIGREDLEIVWIILDNDKSGLVSYTEFIAQLLGMKNSDSQFMLAYIKYYITVIRENMSSQMATLQETMQFGIKTTEAIQKITEEEKKAIQVENENIQTLLSKAASTLGAEPNASAPMAGLEQPIGSRECTLVPPLKEKKADPHGFDESIRESRKQQTQLMF